MKRLNTKSSTITLTSQQLATVLSALRYLQLDLIAHPDGLIDEDHFPTENGQYTEEIPLNPDEIDTLCEHLNK